MKNIYWTLFHPNAKGTGSAIRMELAPAEPDTPGRLRVTVAPQKSVGSAFGDAPTFPTFGWGEEEAVAFDLSPVEATRVLLVLRGYDESIEDGKGIFQRTEATNRVVRFAHMVEPLPGYELSVAESAKGGAPRQARFRFTAAEALALNEAISGGMGALLFG